MTTVDIPQRIERTIAAIASDFHPSYEAADMRQELALEFIRLTAEDATFAAAGYAYQRRRLRWMAGKLF